MSGWRRDALAVAYDDRLLDWQLGDNHPTNPVRAKLCVEALQAADLPLVVEPITWQLTDQLEAVHTRGYIDETLTAGRNSEWSGERPDLGAVAAHMFAATVQVVHAIDAGDVRIGFSPQGAKHHAMADHGSGFCVFNDMAWAAQHFAAQGKRVLYVDLDAHHGDGVEALTRDNPLVMTCSVHDSTIFPGTGQAHEPDRHVYNYALAHGAGDVELLESVAAVEQLAADWQPDVLLVAIGADGHETDPLSSLQCTYDG
jgi:acetoin utilization protein AcuC